MENVCVATGSSHRIGRAHGEQLSAAVGSNVHAFLTIMAARGWDRHDLAHRALQHAEGLRRHGTVSDSRLSEITGIAEGARCSYPEVLAYNLFSGEAFPDECTVMFALPDATASRKLIFLKNSDKIGGANMVGDGFYEHKEINVVVVVRPEGRPAIVGIGSAGSTGLKMGVNDCGVATGTNISRTTELRTRKVSTTQERALDRVQLSRDGLEHRTAMAAGNDIVAKLAVAPMSTPGNLEFVDTTLGYVIEGSYDRLAVQLVREGVGVRTNRFVLLESLNDPNDLSSYCRYVRCNHLLDSKVGRLTVEDFIEFSTDHANGPGPNSICRHGTHYEDETSQSAQIMEVDAADPKLTKVWLSLGKPCWAWCNTDGYMMLTMRFKPEDVPAGFRDGNTWKRFWTEQPNVQKAAVRATG